MNTLLILSLEGQMQYAVDVSPFEQGMGVGIWNTVIERAPVPEVDIELNYSKWLGKGKDNVDSVVIGTGDVQDSTGSVSGVLANPSVMPSRKPSPRKRTRPVRPTRDAG